MPFQVANNQISDVAVFCHICDVLKDGSNKKAVKAFEDHMKLPKLVHYILSHRSGGGGTTKTSSGDDHFTESDKESDSPIKTTKTKPKKNRFLESDESESDKSLKSES